MQSLLDTPTLISEVEQSGNNHNFCLFFYQTILLHFSNTIPFQSYRPKRRGYFSMRQVQKSIYIFAHVSTAQERTPESTRANCRSKSVFGQPRRPSSLSEWYSLRSAGRICAKRSTRRVHHTGRDRYVVQANILFFYWQSQRDNRSSKALELRLCSVTFVQ